MKKGLSFDLISEKALELTVRNGYGCFTVRELAKELDVKAASLYNHIHSMDEVNAEVGLLASGRLGDALNQAAQGLEYDDAIRSVAHAYRTFIIENPELQKAIMELPLLVERDIPGGKKEGIMIAARSCLDTIRNLVGSYKIEEPEAVHLSRSFRSSLIGFITLEQSGYFRATKIPVSDSFEYLIESYIRQLKTAKTGK